MNEKEKRPSASVPIKLDIEADNFVASGVTFEALKTICTELTKIK